MSLLHSRRSMRGYAVWAALLVAAGVAGVLLYRSVSPAADHPLTAEEAAALDSFSQAVALDSTAQREAWERRFPPYGRHNGDGWQHNGKYHPRPVETFPFDPNKADSITFLRLGLRPWQAHNALQYRRKGGTWRSPEHFSKLYGLNEEDYRRLAPYIRIDSALVRANYNRASRGGSSNSGDAVSSSSRLYPEKYEAGTVTFDLNACDTTDLRHIPEIGSYRAAQIVRYREQLGGYVSVAQLREIQGLPQDIEKWFAVVSGEEVDKIDINNATFQQLVRHPYISYEQAREIMNYRRRFGRLTNWDDLRLSPHFAAKDFQRLRPYIAF